MTFLIGFLAGVFGGLLGVGGGIIMSPFMVSLRGLGLHKAHGTSLVALVFTGISGAIAYGIKGSVVGTLPSSWRLPPLSRPGPAHILSIRFLTGSSSAPLAVPPSHIPPAAAQTLPAGSPDHGFESAEDRHPASDRSLHGILIRHDGSRRGVIMIPAMVLLAGFEQHLAQGTSLLTMVPAGIVGAYTHGKLGNVKKGMLAGLIPGILLGTYLGGTLAHGLSERSLRIVFAGVLVWTGVRYRDRTA